MPLSNHDPETIRRYLLGQLTDDEEATTEERILSDDDFFEEMEVTKDELVDEYLAKQLTKEEAGWFEQNFLVSPEGKQRQGFAKALNRYVGDHRLVPQTNPNIGQRLVAFWNRQPTLLRAAGAMALVAIAVGIFWYSRGPAPKSFATLILNSTSTTRSGGGEVRKIKLNEDALRLVFMLPPSAAPAVRYRVDLMNDNGETKTSEVAGNKGQSVSVEIPAAELQRGHYVVTLWAINTERSLQRIPGTYQFIVE